MLKAVCNKSVINVNDHFVGANKMMNLAKKPKDWKNFLKVLNKTKGACKNFGFNIDEQLVDLNKLLERKNNDIVNIQDYELSRYIYYLIVQNLNHKKCHR